MRQVPIATFKDRISEFIAAVARGEEITITRHGKAAARLLPPAESADARSKRARDALERMARMRDRMRAEGRTATVEK